MLSNALKCARFAAMFMLCAGATLGPVPNHDAPLRQAGITAAPGAMAISDQGPGAASAWDDDVEYAIPHAPARVAPTVFTSEPLHFADPSSVVSTEFTQDLLRPPRV